MATSVVADLLANSDRAKVVSTHRDVLSLAGDAERGRAVFRKVCAACHKMEGFGHEIGPSLAAMRNRGSEAILVNVLDPNREVNPQYLSYTVITADGRTLSGMIAAETATSIELRRAEDKSDTVLRIDIEAMKSTGMSLMPEGMEKQIDKQALADLLEYLRRFE
jgi:putative heme-binding domain-containing protein